MTEQVQSEQQLRARYGETSRLAAQKLLPRLDVHARRFIELSPVLVISSHGPDGLGDVSPQGDAPGFRSEERRVGTEGVRAGRARWAPFHLKKKEKQNSKNKK